MCMKYWLTACSSLPRKKHGYGTDVTIAVDLGCKATTQTNKSALKTNIIFENRKRKVFEILEQIQHQSM